MHTQTTTWLAAKLYLDFGFNILNKNEKNGWNILKTLTNHPKLNEFETLKIEEVYDKRNVEIEAQLNQIFKDDSFNYSVWYKNGLHNVYVYYKNSTYEYEYFDDEDKIILKEVENKKYKRYFVTYISVTKMNIRDLKAETGDTIKLNVTYEPDNATLKEYEYTKIGDIFMKDNKGNIIAKKDGISKITIKHKTQKLIKSIVIKVDAKKKEEVKEYVSWWTKFLRWLGW